MTTPSPATILVTGVGGGVGHGILKSLAGASFRTIGADGEPTGAGLYATEKSYLIPYARKDEFIPRLLEICRRESCRLLFPGLDAELPKLAEATVDFQAVGCEVIVSHPKVIRLCDDKYATAQFLREQGFPAPETYLLDRDFNGENKLPLIVKPQIGGARSQGMRLIRTAQEWSQWVANGFPANYIAQEFIEGDEYTCGTVNFDGHCYGPIVMRRILRDGDTYKAFVEQRPEIESLVRDVAAHLQPFGACNFQLRLRAGVPFIFEINPRCSGTTSARSLAGFNEPLMIAQNRIHRTTPQYRIRKDLAILRYWQERIVPQARLKQMAADGTIINPEADQ